MRPSKSRHVPSFLLVVTRTAGLTFRLHCRTYGGARTNALAIGNNVCIGWRRLLLRHRPRDGSVVSSLHCKIGPFAAAAIRLLLFTGCRLREILHLERGLLFLADSKTGRKTVILDAPARAVLSGLDRIGSYVVAGDDPEKPRADLKRPWEAVARRARLDAVRLHDLRHTYASFGAGGGLGLPIIGKLLGHTQPSTTQRYAHLDADPLRRASEDIAGRIAAAMEGKRSGAVVQFKRGRRY